MWRNIKPDFLSKVLPRVQPITCSERTTKIFEIICLDLCGPIEVEALGGSRYILIFVDDMYFLRANFFVKTHSDATIKILRTDNRTEYVNNVLLSVLRKSGIN